MAVLSNTEIIRALDEGRLVIEPRPMPEPGDGGDTPYDTVSVDLRLAGEIYVPVTGTNINLDVGKKVGVGKTLQTVFTAETIGDGGTYTLGAGEFILGRTVETVSLPVGEACLAARVEGRSSLARQGLIVHFTAPTIHTDFNGTITLEMINLGKMPLILTPGMRICQLIVESVIGVPTPVGPSQFQNQQTPAG